MSPRDNLRTFLTEQIPNFTKVKDLMDDLEPFFIRADQGDYPLEQKSEELQGEALLVLQTLFPSISKVILVSRDALSLKPDWMTEEVYQNSLRGILRDSFGDILWDSLRDSIEDSLWKSLRDIIGDSWDSLWDILWKSWDTLGDSLDSLWESLFYYIGFTIIGRTEEEEKLKRLIQLLLRAIPLGEKKDEPGTWLVLCA